MVMCTSVAPMALVTWSAFWGPKHAKHNWDPNYVTDRKWWTRLIRNVDSVCTNRVHLRDVVLIPGLLPIFLHGCEIKSGWGLGMRLSYFQAAVSVQIKIKSEPGCSFSTYQDQEWTLSFLVIVTNILLHSFMPNITGYFYIATACQDLLVCEAQPMSNFAQRLCSPVYALTQTYPCNPLEI